MAVMQSPPGAETVIDGKPYLYFGGTAYLGLQGRDDVIRAACRAAEQYGVASATSRGGFGDTPPVVEVERRAAEFFGTEAAFYFPSGYFGNDVLLTALEGAFDAVFIDELSHYSVIEAARVSGQPVFAFMHSNVDVLHGALEAKLEEGGRPLVISDGVFSALGDVAPVAEYCKLLADYPGATLVVDDAHAAGVLGENGRGTYEHAGLWSTEVNSHLAAEDRSSSLPRLLCCATLSKALGGYGGIIPGTGPFVEWLKTTSPYYSGASPPPVPTAAASARALEIAHAEPGLRLTLWRNVRIVKEGLAAMGLATDETPVPILSLTIGKAADMQSLHRELADRGILVPYKPAYAGLGPEGALRLAVFATHTEEMIQRLLDELRRAV